MLISNADHLSYALGAIWPVATDQQDLARDLRLNVDRPARLQSLWKCTNDTDKI